MIIEWTDKYTYNPPIELTAEPQPGVILSVQYERSKFTGNIDIQRQDEKAFFWRIEICDNELNRFYYTCSLDIGGSPKFLNLEICKKQCEEYYAKYLKKSLESEIAEAGEIIKSRTKALKALAGKTK